MLYISARFAQSMEQFDALKAAALADPISALGASIIGLAFIAGAIKIYLFNSRRRKLLEEYGQLETVRIPRASGNWHPLRLGLILSDATEVTDPPSTDPPEGEDAEVGEQARTELVGLRAQWISSSENSEALDEHARDAVSGATADVTMVAEDETQDDQFDKRLEREGGKRGVMQASLMWDNYNDLDLHMFTPSGERIYFNNRHSSCGGELDVDMNVKPSSNSPIENVFWDEMPPPGKYKVAVHHYARHRRWRTKDPTPFKIRVRIGEDSIELAGKISRGDPMTYVHSFNVEKPMAEANETDDEVEVDGGKSVDFLDS